MLCIMLTHNIGYNLAFYLYTFDLNMYSSIKNAYNVIIIMMMMIALYIVDIVLFFKLLYTIVRMKINYNI